MASDHFIDEKGERVFIEGPLGGYNIKLLLALMHGVIAKRGYPDIELDFSRCTRAYSSEMLMICSEARRYKRAGIGVYLTLPNDDRMRKLFINSNWASIIDEQSHPRSTSKSSLHIPATVFRNANEQAIAVSVLSDRLMATMPPERRDDLRFIQWILNEVTDNVINHSRSDLGGIIQLTHHTKTKRVELTISDSGIGIGGSLRSGDYPTISDEDALAAVIKEGVTRHKTAGQGNGLYGTYEIATKTAGRLTLVSGNGIFRYRGSKASTNWKREKIPFNGTLVDVQIGYSQSVDVRDILVIKGEAHVPIDSVDLNYEADDQGVVAFKVANETTLGFGSRVSGRHLRNKAIHILQNDEDARLAVDFRDTGLISSSFADEFLGKLCFMIGVMKFMRRVSIDCEDKLNLHLIEKAIDQRMSVGLEE